MINEISFEELSKTKETLDKEKVNELDWIINTTPRLFPYTLKTGEKVVGIAINKMDYTKVVLLVERKAEAE